MPKSKNQQKIFCFGEQHASSSNPNEGVYAALNAMSEENLQAFVNNNNIKHAFFEFILEDDFELNYDETKGLIIPNLPWEGSCILRTEATHNEARQILLANQYQHVKSFKDLIGIKGDRIQAMDFIQLVGKNSIEFGSKKIHKLGNFAEPETYTHQQQLANKLKKLDVKIYGIESFKSFTASGENGANHNRCPYLNKDGTDIIDKKLQKKEGNAFLVAGDAHFVDYDETDGMQTLLADKGYNCPTVLLTTKNAMKCSKDEYNENNIDILLANVAETKADFHARVNKLAVSSNAPPQPAPDQTKQTQDNIEKLQNVLNILRTKNQDFKDLSSQQILSIFTDAHNNKYYTANPTGKPKLPFNGSGNLRNDEEAKLMRKFSVEFQKQCRNQKLYFSNTNGCGNRNGMRTKSVMAFLKQNNNNGNIGEFVKQVWKK